MFRPLLRLVQICWKVLRSAAHGDIVVPSHRTDWGLRSFAVAGPSSWNALPVGLRSSSFGLDTFAKHLKTHLFGLAYSRQGTHFWVCITFCRVWHGDSVTKPDYYYYYYYSKVFYIWGIPCMYIVTFTVHQQWQMVQTPHFFGWGCHWSAFREIEVAGMNPRNRGKKNVWG